MLDHLPKIFSLHYFLFKIFCFQNLAAAQLFHGEAVSCLSDNEQDYY